MSSDTVSTTSSTTTTTNLPMTQSGVNVQVLLRCRPPNDKEKGQTVSVETAPYLRKELKIHQKLVHGKEITKTFTFDRVYGPQTTQREFFEESIKSIVDEALDGFNCTIFAYGQTSSGKTFTMEGRRDASDVTDSQAGVIPRSIYHIFKTLESNQTEYTVKVSCMELYNEELQDLLTDRQNKLKIFDDNTGRKGTVVAGLEEINVRDASQIISIVEDAQKRRQMAETNLNKSSSRSHCITTITIHMREVNDEGEEFIKTGKLNLVDLAGSENIGRSGAVKQRAKEAGMINQSLLTLGRVITALTEHSPHIPYRESKLTRILQDSLGGKTKTCLIATISPSVLCIEETLSTVDYAHKAKSIKNKPEVNMKVSKAQLIKEMSSDMERLKAELNAQRLKNGIYMAPEIYEETNRKLKEQEATIRDMEDQLQLKVKEYEELAILFREREKDLQREITEHGETRQTLSLTRDTLKKTEFELKNTKEELGATNFVLGKTQETEEQLLSQAHYLLDNLKESISDVDGFISKVDRKNKVESENQVLISQFKHLMDNKFGRSIDEVHTLQSIFNSLNSSAKNSVSEFMIEKESHTKNVRDQLVSMSQLFSTSQNEIMHMIANKSESQSQTLDNLTLTNQSFESSLFNNMMIMKDAFEKSLTIINEQIVAQRGEMLNIHTFFVETLTRNTKFLENFAGKHTEVMKVLKQEIEQTVTEHVNQTSNNSQKLNEMLKQQKLQNASLKQELLRNIESLIDNTFTSQETEFTESVQTIQKFFDHSVNSVQTMDRSVKKSSDESMFSLEKIKTNLGSNQQDAIQSMTKSRINIENLMDSIGEQNSNLTTNINSFHKNTQEAVSSNTSSLNMFASDSKQAQKMFMDECSASSCKSISTFQEYHNQLQHRADNYNNRLGMFANTHLELHNSQHERVNEYKNQFVSERMNDMKRSLDTFSLNTDQPTGTTPQKKKRKLPETLPKTQPRPELVEMYKLSLPESLENDETLVSSPESDKMEDVEADIVSVSSNNKENVLDETLSPTLKINTNVNVVPMKKVNSEPAIAKKQQVVKKPTITKVLKTSAPNFGVSAFR